MAKSAPSILAHHDPSPTYFTLTRDELGNVENCARNPAREYALFCLGLFLPTIANFLADVRKTPFEVAPTLFINGIVSGCTLLVGAFQAINWWRTRSQFRAALRRLREKPLTNLAITSIHTPQPITTADETPTPKPATISSSSSG